MALDITVVCGRQDDRSSKSDIRFFSTTSVTGIPCRVPPLVANELTR
jgi:hypothetical protein